MLTALQAPVPFAPPAVALRDYFRTPAMPADVRFALVRDPECPSRKPSAFETLHRLADRIHRERRGAPLQLQDAYLRVRGEATPRKGVNVWTLDPVSLERVDFIGWAWLDGGDRFLLEAALPRRQGGVAAIRAA